MTATPIELEIQENAVIINSTTKEPLNKQELVKLLKAHRVNTSQVEDSKVAIEDIIAILRKGKIKIP